MNIHIVSRPRCLHKSLSNLNTSDRLDCFEGLTITTHGRLLGLVLPLASTLLLAADLRWVQKAVIWPFQSNRQLFKIIVMVKEIIKKALICITIVLNIMRYYSSYYLGFNLAFLSLQRQHLLITKPGKSINQLKVL